MKPSTRDIPQVRGAAPRCHLRGGGVLEQPSRGLRSRLPARRQSTGRSFLVNGASITTIACVLLVVVTALVGCGPSEQQKARSAEEKRIDCLDKPCAGDKVPSLEQPLEQALMKLNGEYFIAPRAYTKGLAGLAFYWPSRTPITGRPDRQPFPELGQEYSDVAIEIFLSHHDGRPHGLPRYERLLQAQREGRLISKEAIRPGLERWRTQEKDSSTPDLWYVATAYVETDPQGAVLSCRDADPAYARCSSGFVWRPGISGNTRFRARHAVDWPEIYVEVQRVMRLLKKA